MHKRDFWVLFEESPKDFQLESVENSNFPQESVIKKTTFYWKLQLVGLYSLNDSTFYTIKANENSNRYSKKCELLGGSSSIENIEQIPEELKFTF